MKCGELTRRGAEAPERRRRRFSGGVRSYFWCAAAGAAGKWDLEATHCWPPGLWVCELLRPQGRLKPEAGAGLTRVSLGGLALCPWARLPKCLQPPGLPPLCGTRRIYGPSPRQVPVPATWAERLRGRRAQGGSGLEAEEEQRSWKGVRWVGAGSRGKHRGASVNVFNLC